MAEGMFYNVNNGYVEGIVRGYRNALLTGQNYGNLTQCETIDGMLRKGQNRLSLSILFLTRQPIQMMED